MKAYIGIVSLLAALFFVSCSNETNDFNANPVANTNNRPINPVMAGQVRIGMQIWATKNLNVSRYRNGDIIPQVTDATLWANLTTGAWCYYNNDAANGTVYGKLYNWYAVNDPRGLAPVGWHVPSDAEWNSVVIFLGGQFEAGGKMKITTIWNSPNAEATNSSGFSGLPGGHRSGNFYELNRAGRWWSSSDYGLVDTAFFRQLTFNYGDAAQLGAYKTVGLSVRCLKD